MEASQGAKNFSSKKYCNRGKIARIKLRWINNELKRKNIEGKLREKKIEPSNMLSGLGSSIRCESGIRKMGTTGKRGFSYG